MEVNFILNKAIIGKKLGMSQIFAQDGTVIPVTIVEAGPCPVVQKKTVERDGYSALQVAFGNVKPNGVNKPKQGQFKKAGVDAKRYLKELKLDNAESYEIGQEIKCDIFAEGDKVDATGTSKGHGFSGTQIRWNQATGPMAHGSGCHRVVGSMGSINPARVFKNKHMPGHYGCDKTTVQNLTIVRVDAERNLLFIKGGIPGARGSLVVIRDSIKA